jgi:hypothetical protein
MALHCTLESMRLWEEYPSSTTQFLIQVQYSAIYIPILKEIHDVHSFEWYLGPSSWRASVHLWGGDSFYRHSKSSNEALADSGWHCSYCFRTVAEYVVKMRGFSHSDRIGGNMALLEPKHIQDTICKGKDIFGMLPEAYSVSLVLDSSVPSFI